MGGRVLCMQSFRRKGDFSGTGGKGKPSLNSRHIIRHWNCFIPSIYLLVGCYFASCTFVSYNFDEIWCSWRALPNRGFIEKGKRCSGGKKSKLRFTIGLLVNACGEKEASIVVWSSANPRCYRELDQKYYQSSTIANPKHG